MNNRITPQTDRVFFDTPGVSGEIATQWCVITGAPCSGKSTVIESLAQMGHQVVHETARRLIEKGLAKGKTVAEITADRHGFEHRIVRRKAAIEAALYPRDRIFLDRGMPDSIGYFKFHGLDAGPVLDLSRRCRYHRVFFFDPIPYAPDGVRVEEKTDAALLEAMIKDAYHTLGYTVIRVPVLPVVERVRFVLEKV